MKFMRQTAWACAAVVLSAVAGCGEDTTTPTPGPGTSPGPGALEKVKGSEPGDKPAPPRMEPSKAMPLPTPPADAKPSAEPGKAGGGGGQPKLEPPKTEGKTEGKTEKKSASAAVKLTPDEIASIKQLPAADQGPALAQAICPVSDEHLGTMDKPFKVSVAGRTVFLCCDNCEKELKANPKKFLAKLDSAATK